MCSYCDEWWWHVVSVGFRMLYIVVFGVLCVLDLRCDVWWF